MSLSLKCKEQIRGSSSALNFLSARLQKTSHFLLIGPCRKAKITEIEPFFTPIAAKRNSAILYHATREDEQQWTKKKNREYSLFVNRIWLSLQCLQWCVCFYYSRRILRSLASVLEFRHQSVTMKYIETGILKP